MVAGGGGVVQGGLSLVAHPARGRFGRLIKAASEVAREMAEADERERTERYIRMVTTAARSKQGVLQRPATAPTGSSSSSSGGSEQPLSEGEEAAAAAAAAASASGLALPAEALAEWHVPPVQSAQGRPNALAVSYWSATGTGEELGNPAFYYYSPEDNTGRFRCLFGVHMDLGTGQGLGKPALSCMPPEASSDSEAEHEGPAARNLHGGTLRPSIDQLRFGIPETHALGKELGELRRTARAARAAARRGEARQAETARRAARAEWAQLQAQVAGAQGAWFVSSASIERARARMAELQVLLQPQGGAAGGGESEAGSFKRSLRQALLPGGEDSSSARLASAAYPHLLPPGAAVELTSLSVPSLTPLQRAARGLAAASAARAAHVAARDVGGALAEVVGTARLRGGLPLGQDPNTRLGPALGAAQFEAGGDTIFRRTGIGGAENLSNLLGWQGQAAMAEAGLSYVETDLGVQGEGEEGSSGSAQFQAKKLQVFKDSYRRNASAGPKLAAVRAGEEEEGGGGGAGGCAGGCAAASTAAAAGAAAAGAAAAAQIPSGPHACPHGLCLPSPFRAACLPTAACWWWQW